MLLSHEPLAPRKLSQYANLADGTEALTLIRQLNRLYDAEGRAFRVEQIAGGYQLMTRPALADWLRRLAGTPAEVRLSAPAMETLAVVAYRQPVQRAEIEAIRGVACGEMLRQLMDRELVRIAGRSEELGRPFLYGTTQRFLHVFGLESIDELPRAEALRMPLAATAGRDDCQTKESDTVTLTIDDIQEEIGATIGEPGDLGGQPHAEKSTAVADVDDDEEYEFDDEDDVDDDEDDIDDDEDDEDDFDDDFDDDWEEDDLDEEEEEDLDDDEWEEVDDEGEEDEEDADVDDEEDEEEWEEEEEDEA